MITDFFLDMFHIFTTNVIILMDGLIAIDTAVGGLAGMIEVISASSFFVPWDALIINMTVITSFHIGKTTISFMNWTISKIPLVS